MGCQQKLQTRSAVILKREERAKVARSVPCSRCAVKAVVSIEALFYKVPCIIPPAPASCFDGAATLILEYHLPLSVKALKKTDGIAAPAVGAGEEVPVAIPAFDRSAKNAFTPMANLSHSATRMPCPPLSILQTVTVAPLLEFISQGVEPKCPLSFAHPLNHPAAPFRCAVASPGVVLAVREPVFVVDLRAAEVVEVALLPLQELSAL